MLDVLKLGFFFRVRHQPVLFCIFVYSFVQKIHMFYRIIIKPLFFLFNPERAHYVAADLIRFTLRIPGMSSLFKVLFQVEDKRLERTVFGLRFPNPVGLAAGFDKNALLVDEFAELGFGFIEVGTVTPKPQDGNPKPRLFRLIEDEGIINRMGFNNEVATQKANEDYEWAF